MSIRISSGAKQDGIVVGNAFDKYSSRNPIVRWLMHGFDSALSDLVKRAVPATIHEIGCGEGYWVSRWVKLGIPARGSDFSSLVIDLARENAAMQGLSPSLFEVRSIYNLVPELDGADLIVCCEVLEHLQDPVAGLVALRSIVGRHLIVSVPREPIWRLLNLARGKYIGELGNTPGHIQHWTSNTFIAEVAHHFEILDIRTPLPWTMLLCRPRS